MVELYLIRHGKTHGNTLGRYIGTTDESLCREGLEALKGGRYPQVEAVYVSPMKRCVETARELWPKEPMEVCDSFRECDFGDFENKNYRELSQNKDYQAWVDSGGTLPFPGGESQEAFRLRCREGFLYTLKRIRKAGFKRVAFVVHGGTIMSILEAYGVPKEEFYHWQAKNGQGFLTHWDETDRGGIALYETVSFCPDSGLFTGSDLR